METTFLYVLTDPTTGVIRYLGKSNDPFSRFKSHLRASEPPSHKKSWIDSLKRVGLTPHMELLDEVPISQWEFWEREYIRVFRAIGIPLTNQCDGGEGSSMPPEVRAKLSAIGKSRVWSEESRKKNSTSHKESLEAQAQLKKLHESKKGVPQSLEHKANNSKAQKDSSKLRAHLTKLHAANTGVPLTPARCANISASLFSHHQFRRMPWFTDGEGI